MKIADTVVRCNLNKAPNAVNVRPVRIFINKINDLPFRLYRFLTNLFPVYRDAGFVSFVNIQNGEVCCKHNTVKPV